MYYQKVLNLSMLKSVPGALSPDVKWTVREADRPPPSAVEVKNAWSYPSTQPYIFMAWYLLKLRYSFTLPYLTLPYLTSLEILTSRKRY
jgi:hypothetical protein